MLFRRNVLDLKMLFYLRQFDNDTILNEFGQYIADKFLQYFPPFAAKVQHYFGYSKPLWIFLTILTVTIP